MHPDLPPAAMSVFLFVNHGSWVAGTSVIPFRILILQILTLPFSPKSMCIVLGTFEASVRN